MLSKGIELDDPDFSRSAFFLLKLYLEFIKRNEWVHAVLLLNLPHSDILKINRRTFRLNA